MGTMNIAIIGAGATGSVLGGLLARAGLDVTLVGRPPQVSAINRNGLAIDGALGSFVVSVRAREQLDFVPDLAMLAVKTQDLAVATLENRLSLQDTTVLTLQNGVRADQMVADLIGAEHLYSAVVLFGATFLEPGRVTYAPAGPLVIGKAFGTPDPGTLQKLAATLGQAIPTHTTTNISGAHWAKLLINENNALPAITGLSLQEVNRLPELRRLAVLLMKETLKVFRSADIVPISLPALPIGRVKLLLGMPVVLAQAVPLLLSRSLGERAVLGSTLQSIKRGEKTEIDYLNGEVVALGERTGTPTPYNTAVVELVHQVEDQHQFMSVRHLRASLNERQPRLRLS
jgi:2-dehydropantoate 2-reductase